MRKLQQLKTELPEPRLIVAADRDGDPNQADETGEIDLLVISWGSTTDVVEDTFCSEQLQGKRVACLHYTYLWPLRTEKLQDLAKRSKHSVLVEQNFQGQLGKLIKMECGLDITEKILKYDGRPFFYDELLSALLETVRGKTSL